SDAAFLQNERRHLVERAHLLAGNFFVKNGDVPILFQEFHELDHRVRIEVPELHQRLVARQGGRWLPNAEIRHRPRGNGIGHAFLIHGHRHRYTAPSCNRAAWFDTSVVDVCPFTKRSCSSSVDMITTKHMLSRKPRRSNWRLRALVERKVPNARAN